jgi:hypothetical protein
MPSLNFVKNLFILTGVFVAVEGRCFEPTLHIRSKKTKKDEKNKMKEEENETKRGREKIIKKEGEGEKR